jgi:hypothetical protein
MSLNLISPAINARTAETSVTSVAANASAVSWGAILAGAAAAAALSLILLILGTGLGLSSVSAWRNDGVSATTLGVSTILWITFTQIIASGMGGYVAGRLRTHWSEVARDEVYFRDTAHGFLAWAVASLITATVLASAVSSIIGGGAKVGGSMVASVASSVASSTASSPVTGAAASDGPTAYFLDSLFRANSASAPELQKPNPSAEVSRIFLNALQTDSLSVEDTQYVSQLVAQRTGLSPLEAEKRVTDTFMKMKAKIAETQASVKQAAEKTRQSSAYAALWFFVSLLAGAFAAAYTATFGGGRRDSVVTNTR